jgi:hypothetical protein
MGGTAQFYDEVGNYYQKHLAGVRSRFIVAMSKEGLAFDFQ